MGCHFLLQRIFLTQGSNPNLLHFGQSPALQADSLPPYHVGSPIFNSLETKRFENCCLKQNQDSPSRVRGLSSLPGGMRLLDLRGALKPSRLCEEAGVSVGKWPRGPRQRLQSERSPWTGTPGTRLASRAASSPVCVVADVWSKRQGAFLLKNKEAL